MGRCARFHSEGKCLRNEKRRVHDSADRRRVLVEPIEDRVTTVHTVLASASRSLAQLIERYSASELAVISDFLARNAKRLRSEMNRLETARTAQA